MADYGDYGPSRQKEAVDILRQRFGGFAPTPDPNDEPTIIDDPLGAIALKSMREDRAGELSDRLDREEAAALVPHEGYVQGEPGRRTRSNAADVMSAFLTRKRLGHLGAEMAADPFTGQAEQDRVAGIRDTLTNAEMIRRPELTDAAHADASRNAFAEFMKKQAGYKAETSPEGQAALDAASKRKVGELTAGHGAGPLVQVPDPEHPGRTMWARREDAVGAAGPLPAAERTRVASAQTVQDTGDDIIKQLADPNIASMLGPVMGRYNTLQDFIGNPPPELANLAGQIDSYSMANMGVHGMRSSQGVEMIKSLLTQKHTPASLAAAIRGLSAFSQHFVENTTGGGRRSPTGGNSPTILSIEKE